MHRLTAEEDEPSTRGAQQQHRRRLPSSSSSSNLLPNDLVICTTAYSHLSCFTRSTLLCVGCILVLLTTYEFAFDKGVREQMRDIGGEDGGEEMGISNGIEEMRGFINRNKDDNEGHNIIKDSIENGEGGGGGGRKFTIETLHNTRTTAQSLLDMLDIYYGGRDKATNMLVHSWQAQWMLDDDAQWTFGDLVEGGRMLHVNDNKVVVINGHNDDKGPKSGKVIVNPDNMTPEETHNHDYNRRQRTIKLISTMARAVLDPYRTQFIIGTIGSSVAAGHDNCHYDSYESQLERTLTPVFVAAGMGIQVQNAGEGGSCGDTHQNQVFCITHNVSPDVDIVHYSWTYFEKEGAEEQREQLIRWSQRMERRPMVHHLVARGLKNTCNGDVQANVDLDVTYASFGYNAYCIQTGLYSGGHDYDTEMEHDGINRFGWQYHGDGYHNTTRYGEELNDDDPRKASLGTVYRNWHPGPLGFQIAADAFAYLYTMGLMKALEIIEEDMMAGVNVLDRWFDTRRRETSSLSSSSSLDGRQLLQLPQSSLPEPLFCDPLYCTVPHPPSCLNYELPTFGTSEISVRSQSNWTVWHEDNPWSNMVGKVDTAIIKALHDPEWEKKCTHLDACGGISPSSSTTGTLVQDFPTLTYELPSSKMTAGLIFICGYPGNKADSAFIQNPSVSFTLNGKVLDKRRMDVYPNSKAKCIRLLRQFGDDGHEKEDTMLLSIEVSDANYTMVSISHVVVL